MTEDLDLTWQYLEAGNKVILEPYAVCYPVEPNNYKTYSNQLKRWYSGFWQNIKFHGLRIFRNKRLTFFISWYLIEVFIFPVGIVLTILFARQFSWFILAAILIDLLIISTLVLGRAKKEGKFKVGLRSLGWAFLIRPINTFLFLRALWKELVVKDSLQVWKKGH